MKFTGDYKKKACTIFRSFRQFSFDFRTFFRYSTDFAEHYIIRNKFLEKNEIEEEENEEEIFRILN